MSGERTHLPLPCLGMCKNRLNKITKQPETRQEVFDVKKIIVALACLLFAGMCDAQVTPNLALNLPNYASLNWNVPLNQNFTILDNYLGGVNAFPNPLKASITGTAPDLSGGDLGSIPYQSASGVTAFLAGNTTTSNLVLCEQGNGTVAAAPTWCAGGGGGGVSSFSAPSASWPSWLVPTVTNPTTTPSLTVSASAIPNSALQYASTTVNGVVCTLGGTCTVPAAAGTLTGTTLASNVTNSSLTSVGTITSGVWQGTPIANSYLANNYTTVNGQVCQLGASCTIATNIASNLSGGALGSIPYQSSNSTTSMLAPNTTVYTYYLCETGTGTSGSAPAWCAGTSPAGTVTSVGLAMPAGQFTVTGSPITSSGTLTVALNSPSGTGNIVLNTAPTISQLAVTTSFTATGLVTNADLANSSTTINGTTCTLGSTCTVTASSTGITVGSTTVSGGTSGYILYDNAGTLGNLATTGTGNVVLASSPALTGTPTAPTATAGTSTTQIATTAFVQSASVGGSLTTANVTLGSGAGTGATVTSVSGTDNTHQIIISTGTSPVLTSLIFTLTYTGNRGHIPYCVANKEASTSYSSIQQIPSVSNETATSYQFFSGSTALAASTTYSWNVVCP